MNTFQIAVTATLLACAPGLTLARGDAVTGQSKSVACHACHGATGQSTQPQYPKLGGQQQSYLNKALHDYREGKRNNAIMNGFASGLSDTDIEDIAAWYASQRGLTEIPTR